MAVIHGESGAWKDARAPLYRINIYPDDTDSVRAIFQELEEAWKRSAPEAAIAYEQRTLELEQQATAKRLEADAEKLRLQKEHGLRMGKISGKVQPLPLDAARIRRWQRWILAAPFLLRKLYLEKNLSRKLEAAAVLPAASEQALKLHLATQDEFLELYRSTSRQCLNVAQSVLESPEYAGAVAEEETLRQLQRLPDAFHILADVRLHYHRYLFYEGEHLKTAQLDFVVVGPTGCFIIEVKQWSQAFIDAGNFHNPFAQVARQSYLCYKLLKEAGLQTKTRTIIATRSQMSPKPKQCYTKVLVPDNLCGFIQYFSPILEPDRVLKLVRFLGR